MLLIDVGDGMCWWQLLDIGDGFENFGLPYIFTLASGTNNQIMSPTSKFLSVTPHNGHSLEVTNITVTKSNELVQKLVFSIGKTVNPTHWIGEQRSVSTLPRNGNDLKWPTSFRIIPTRFFCPSVKSIFRLRYNFNHKRFVFSWWQFWERLSETHFLNTLF